MCRCWTFKGRFHKKVKHTQTIRRQIAYKLFECVWPFCGIGAYRVNHYVIVDGGFAEWLRMVTYNNEAKTH